MMSITRLAQDDRGASIIELALVAPILASLLIGMVDLSRAYSHKLLLEQAAQRSIEKVQQYQASSSTPDLLIAETVAAAKLRASRDEQCRVTSTSGWNATASARPITIRSVRMARPTDARVSVEPHGHVLADVPLAALAWREHRRDVHAQW